MIERLDPESLIGHLQSVSASWHVYEGRRSAEPMHVWLQIEELGSVLLDCGGDGSLVLAPGEPYDPYSMDEYGTVEVQGGGPEELADHVGDRIVRVSRLDQTPPGAEVGIVLHFDQAGSVGIANLGDEFEIAAWPAPMWADFGVTGHG